MVICVIHKSWTAAEDVSVSMGGHLAYPYTADRYSNLEQIALRVKKKLVNPDPSLSK